jgi:hypothetical protein
MTMSDDLAGAPTRDLYTLFGLSRRPAPPVPARFNASRALQQLPAVIYDSDLLWQLGFRSHALRPTNLGGGGWR